MDLVDIDKVLDDFEATETNAEKFSQRPESLPGNGVANLNRRRLQENQPASRKIKVSSVFSSLNDYVDYDNKQQSIIASSDKKETLIVVDSVLPAEQVTEKSDVRKKILSDTGSFNGGVLGEIKSTKEAVSDVIASKPKVEDQLPVNLPIIEVIASEPVDDKTPVKTDKEEKVTIQPCQLETPFEVSSELPNQIIKSNKIEIKSEVVPEKEVPKEEIIAAVKFQDDFTDQELETYLSDLEHEYDQADEGKAAITLPTLSSEEHSSRAQIIETILKHTEEASPKVEVDEKLEKLQQSEEEKKSQLNMFESSEEQPNQVQITELNTEEASPKFEVDDELEKLQQLEEEEKKRQLDMDLQMALELANEEELEQLPNVSESNPSDNQVRDEINQIEVADQGNEATGLELGGVDDTEYRFLMSLGKSAPYWVPDSTHEACMQCNQKFSLIKRRHHCRCCGELLCSVCCSFRAHLDYILNQQIVGGNSSTAPFPTTPTNSSPNEARICKKCDLLFKKRDQVMINRMVVETGSSATDFQIKGVLKKPKPQKKKSEEDEADTETDDASDLVTTPTKNVIFSDGVRPGHDDFDEDKSSTPKPRATKAQVTSAPKQATEPEQKNLKDFVFGLKAHYNEKTKSFLPTQKTVLPPILVTAGTDGTLPAIVVKNDFQTCLDLCDYLKKEKRSYLIQKRLHCSVKIVNLSCCISKWCLNMTTNGLSLLGQKELIILVEINDDYFVNGSPNDKRNLNFLLLLMRRLFLHFNKIYTRISNDIRTEKLHIRERKKVELSQHSETASLFRHENHVVITPFHYFNSFHSPSYASVTRRIKPTGATEKVDSDESDQEEEFLTEKYPFLKRQNCGFIQSMELHKITFGIRGDPEFFLDFSAILYVEANYQCLENLVLPDEKNGSYLFGLFVKKTEIPWAKLFPLRLMLRLGAEYHLYPCPLFNALDRKCVFTEMVDNTIIHFLADFQNYTFTLSEIPGLVMYMENEKDAEKKDEERSSIKICLPKLNFKRIETMINSSSESILAFFGNFNVNADGHLVCIQQVPGNDGSTNSPKSTSSYVYSTQSLNIDSKQDKDLVKTGINFFILNGALKSTTGLQAKVNIIEDGVMIQVLPQTMQKVRTDLLEMKDVRIVCGISDEEKLKLAKKKVTTDVEEPVHHTDHSEVSAEDKESKEVIEFTWTDDFINFSSGIKSEIDSKSLDRASHLKIQCDLFLPGDTKSNPKKPTRPPKKPLFSFSPVPSSSQKESELENYYLHFQEIYLIDEPNYFYLFNGKMLNRPDDSANLPNGEQQTESLNPSLENANLIKFLNVNNWEISSINFLIKLASVLARTIHKALSKSYAQMYGENVRRFSVRFKFEADQMVSYEAGSSGTKLATSYMNDLDMELIPMLHALLQLQPKSGSFPSRLMDGADASSRNNVLLGKHLNSEFVDKLHLLQNLQHAVTFELVLNILLDI